MAETLLLVRLQKLLPEKPDSAHLLRRIWQAYLLGLVEAQPVAAIPYSNLSSSLFTYGFPVPKLTQTPPTGYELVSLQTHIPIIGLYFMLYPHGTH